MARQDSHEGWRRGTEPWRTYRYTELNPAEGEKAINDLMNQRQAVYIRYKEAKKQLWNYDQRFAQLEWEHEQLEDRKSHAEKYSWKLQLASLIFLRDMLHKFVKLKSHHLEIINQHMEEFSELERLPEHEILVDEFPLD